MKILGFNISLAKKATEVKTSDGKKRRASLIIRKQISREVSYEIKDITTALNVARNVDYPDRARLMDIYEYINRDGHLTSQLRTARLKVRSEPWLLYRKGTPDMAASELFNKTWFNKIIEYALDQEFYGFSVVELDELNPAETTIGTVILIPRKHISIEKQWILIDGNINGDYLPYGDVMQQLDLIEFGTRDEYGTLLQCAYNVIWKFYSRSDWARSSEKAGMPITAIKADTNDDKELDEMETRAANLGTDGFIIVQRTDEVSFLERKNENGHLIYKDNIGLCNEELSKTINGNTATTDTKAFSGSAEVQERTMDDFTEGRMQMIVNNINDVFLPYLVAKGFKCNDLRFDYPLLKRTRESKINGPQLPAPGADKKDDAKEDDTKDEPKEK